MAVLLSSALCLQADSTLFPVFSSFKTLAASENIIPNSMPFWLTLVAKKETRVTWFTLSKMSSMRKTTKWLFQVLGVRSSSRKNPGLRNARNNRKGVSPTRLNSSGRNSRFDARSQTKITRSPFAISFSATTAIDIKMYGL